MSYKTLFTESKQGMRTAAAVLALMRAVRHIFPGFPTRYNISSIHIAMVKEIWDSLCAEKKEFLSELDSVGDRVSALHKYPTSDDWKLLEPVLMYASDQALDVVTEESLYECEKLRALTVLARLLGAALPGRRAHLLQHNNARLWDRVLAAYKRTGRCASVALLQRRWRRLVALATRKPRDPSPLLLYIMYMIPNGVTRQEQRTGPRARCRPPRAADTDVSDNCPVDLSLDFTELEKCKGVDAINEYIRTNFFEHRKSSKTQEGNSTDDNLCENSNNSNDDDVAIVALQRLDPAKTQVSIILDSDSDDFEGRTTFKNADDLLAKATHNVLYKFNEDVSTEPLNTTQCENEVETLETISSDERFSENLFSSVFDEEEITGVDDNTSIDIKLLSITQVQLSRIDDSAAWRKHFRNHCIDVRRAGFLGTKETKDSDKNSQNSVFDESTTSDCDDSGDDMEPLVTLKNASLIRSNSYQFCTTVQSINQPDNIAHRTENGDNLKLENGCYRRHSLNPDLYPRLKGLSESFLANEKNLRLLKICKPLLVRLTDVERPRRRPVKKVELSDIDEVRRINKSILTAQVMPFPAQEVPSPAQDQGKVKMSSLDVPLALKLKGLFGEDWKRELGMARHLRLLQDDMTSLFGKSFRVIRRMVQSTIEAGYCHVLEQIIDLITESKSSGVLRRKIYKRKKKEAPLKEIVEEESLDPYQEWERQKKIANKYFHIGMTRREDAKKNRTHTVSSRDTENVIRCAESRELSTEDTTLSKAPEDQNPLGALTIDETAVDTVVTPVITGVCSLVKTEVIEDDTLDNAKQENPPVPTPNVNSALCAGTVKPDDLFSEAKINPHLSVVEQDIEPTNTGLQSARAVKRHIPVDAIATGPSKRHAKPSKPYNRQLPLTIQASNKQADTQTPKHIPLLLPVNIVTIVRETSQTNPKKVIVALAPREANKYEPKTKPVSEIKKSKTSQTLKGQVRNKKKAPTQSKSQTKASRIAPSVSNYIKTIPYQSNPQLLAKPLQGQTVPSANTATSAGPNCQPQSFLFQSKLHSSVSSPQRLAILLPNIPSVHANHHPVQADPFQSQQPQIGLTFSPASISTSVGSDRPTKTSPIQEQQLVAECNMEQKLTIPLTNTATSISSVYQQPYNVPSPNPKPLSVLIDRGQMILPTNAATSTIPDYRSTQDQDKKSFSVQLKPELTSPPSTTATSINSNYQLQYKVPLQETQDSFLGQMESGVTNLPANIATSVNSDYLLPYNNLVQNKKPLSVLIDQGQMVLPTNTATSSFSNYQAAQNQETKPLSVHIKQEQTIPLTNTTISVGSDYQLRCNDPFQNRKPLSVLIDQGQMILPTNPATSSISNYQPAQNQEPKPLSIHIKQEQTIPLSSTTTSVDSDCQLQCNDPFQNRKRLSVLIDQGQMILPSTKTTPSISNYQPTQNQEPKPLSVHLQQEQSIPMTNIATSAKSDSQLLYTGPLQETRPELPVQTRERQDNFTNVPSRCILALEPTTTSFHEPSLPPTYTEPDTSSRSELARVKSQLETLLTRDNTLNPIHSETKELEYPQDDSSDPSTPDIFVVTIDMSKRVWKINKDYVILTERLLPSKRPAYWSSENKFQFSSRNPQNLTSEHSHSVVSQVRARSDEKTETMRQESENDKAVSSSYSVDVNEHNEQSNITGDRNVGTEGSINKNHIESDSLNEVGDTKSEARPSLIKVKSFANVDYMEPERGKTEDNPDILKRFDKYFKKLSNNPLRYGLLLSAVPSVEECVSLLRQGAPLYVMNQHTFHMSRLRVERLPDDHLKLQHPDRCFLHGFLKDVTSTFSADCATAHNCSRRQIPTMTITMPSLDVVDLTDDT